MIRWPFVKRNPAAELARIGVEKRRREVLAVAQQIRAELGMEPSPALERRA